jgi:hypothetical protein
VTRLSLVPQYSDMVPVKLRPAQPRRCNIHPKLLTSTRTSHHPSLGMLSKHLQPDRPCNTA